MKRNTITLLALTAALAAAPLAAQRRAALPAKDRPVTIPTRTLFQVGELEGEDYENFASVTDVAFDAQGRLFVLDATAHRVIVFDEGGDYFRTIGRQGDGPGEFGFPTALAVLPTGELVVNDATKANLQIFGPDGTFLRTVVLDQELGRTTGRMRISPKGGLITETMQLQRLVNQAERGLSQRLQLPPRSVARLTIGESASGRRLFDAPPRDLQLATPKAANGGTMRIAMSLTAFEPSLLWSPTVEGGVAALNGAPYRITLTDSAGRVVRYLERPIQPRKVTAADRKRFLENQKKGIGAGGAGGVAMVAVGSHAAEGSPPPRAPSATNIRMSGVDIKESDVTWSDVIPVVSALGTDSFGRLWVQRSAPGLGDGPIDLIDPASRYLGTLPQQQFPRAFGPQGRVAYVLKDDFDVQRVVVKQLLR